jgi:RNA polymerase-binding transcription factor DksA
MALINEQAARRRLEAQRAALLRRLGITVGRSPAGAPRRTGGLTSATEGSRGLELRSHTLALLEQVEGALHQLDRGQYGVCLACGGMIRPERLEALPYATLCVACSAKSTQA